MGWTVHTADTSGALSASVSRILQSVSAAEERVIALMGNFDMDVVVQNTPGRVIPELGFVGYAPTGWLVHLAFDATNDNMASHLGEPLERTMAHEANHALRWRGPGYGTTLGAALISEGLAGQFTREIYDNPPEPWEVPAEDDLTFLGRVCDGWDEGYDHNAWFFGSGDLPAWLGYRLGYRIVARHIERAGQQASALTMRPAEDFKETVMEMAA